MNIAGHPAWGRLMALAVLALLMAAVWVGPINLYLNLVGSGAQRIAREARLLQRYRALAHRPVPAAAPTTSGMPLIMLPQVPEAQAVALMQQTLKRAAVRSRVEVRGLQVLRSEAMPGADRISVRVTASGDMASLVRLLFAIETSHPVLYPDNLQIRSRGAVRGTPPADLDFQLDVSGFKPGAAG